MNIDATLHSADNTQAWSVLSMALYMEVERLPRLFVQIEADSMPGIGPLTLILSHSTNGIVSFSDLSRSTWSVSAVQHNNALGRYLLSLTADPSGGLEWRPFCANDQTAQALLAGAIDGSDLAWLGGAASPTIEALLSYGETLEQLARRIARLTNETFAVFPKAGSGWTLAWDAALKQLGSYAVVTDGVVQLASITRVLEPYVQALTVPASYDGALLETAPRQHAFSAFRPLQLGVAGTLAVTHGMPLNEDGNGMSSLQARWYALTDISVLDAVWRGARIIDGTDTADAGAFSVSSIFLYDGNAAASKIGQTGALFAQLAGCGELTQHNGQGWLALALALPLDQIPQEKALLGRALEEAGVHLIWQQLIQSIGCGYHDLIPKPAPAWGVMQAVVVDNPAAPGNGAVGRSVDNMQYQTKIWVRILGVAGTLKVDWATPFASHDNSGSGGGHGGDLILVPEKNTLGYVSFLEQQGAPFFHAMTHYRDTPVSAKLDPTLCRHGLATDRGLCILETSTNIIIQAKDLLTLGTRRMLHKINK